MAVIYVAKSPALQEWGSDVGISKHVYKVGVAEGEADDIVKELIDTRVCGQVDWGLVAHQTIEGQDEAAVLARLGHKEKMIDPTYYPKIKGAQGVFKVNPVNVEARLLVQQALSNQAPKAKKLKPADIGAYLIANALG